MTTEIKTTMNPIHTASIRVNENRILDAAAQVGRFSLHFLEMSAAMMIGMPLLSMLRNLIPASSNYSAAFKPGTILAGLAMVIFMTVPMVAWMVVRGHGWRHSAEMAFAMLAPVAALIVLRLLGADAYLPWLASASHLAMPLGMLAAMLYRRDHYTGKASHVAHAAHQ